MHSPLCTRTTNLPTAAVLQAHGGGRGRGGGAGGGGGGGGGKDRGGEKRGLKRPASPGWDAWRRTAEPWPGAAGAATDGQLAAADTTLHWQLVFIPAESPQSPAGWGRLCSADPGSSAGAGSWQLEGRL